jgi:uncharacterized membrane protein
MKLKGFLLRNRAFIYKWLPILILIIFSLLFFIYGYLLANKRYNNYEYGKFDLGNMSQMVWNSSRGNFMEITDQFGTNMPRWGMSHVDPLLLIFVPIFWVYANPMVLVFFQHLVIFSAIYPIYKLSRFKGLGKFTSTLIGMTYVLYPALGYTLVWTTFHGISFAAPLFLWWVYFLEYHGFKISGLKQQLIYWILFLLILFGKEELGFILFLYVLFFFNGFKFSILKVVTMFLALSWSLVSFLWIIPSYSNLRQQSINDLITVAGINETKVENIDGQNFFLTRYAHFGDSYGSIVKNMLFKPQLLIKDIFSKEHLEMTNYMIGPLGYLFLLNPIWLISIPDLAILLLSKEPIYAIDNHRVAFIFAAYFLSYIYFLAYLKIWFAKRNLQYNVSFIYSFISFCLAIWFSFVSQNPVVISGESFFREKIVSRVIAKENNQTKLIAEVVGDAHGTSLPRNSKLCIDTVRDFVIKIDPQIYSGPDYLGDHLSLRRVNALFPARINDAELIVVDIFDEKAVDRLGVELWTINKSALKKAIHEYSFKEVFACDGLIVFTKNEDELVDLSSTKYQYQYFDLSTRDIDMKVSRPLVLDGFNITYSLTLIKGSFYDKIGYIKIVDPMTGNVVRFFDYQTLGGKQFPGELGPNIPVNYVHDLEWVGLKKDHEYKFYYGAGNLLKASEVYLGKVVFN